MKPLPPRIDAALSEAAAAMAALETDTPAPVQPLAAQAFKARLQAEGKTITEWAAEHGFPRGAVYRVMGGFDKAHYGQAHRIAVAIGLKPAPATDTEAAA